MQQYRVEFFETHYAAEAVDRRIQYVHHDFCNNLTIDDDYLSAQTTTIEINATEKVKSGQFIRILRDEEDYFFGVVDDVSPGKNQTMVNFKPFISLFDEPVILNTTTQYVKGLRPGVPLETVLSSCIAQAHILNGDAIQCYPFSITVPEEQYLTDKWNMNIQSDTEGTGIAIVNLYTNLLVRALKEYGIALRAVPDFSSGQINLVISRISDIRNIDADLSNIVLKTFKVNDRPRGTNKLIVYNPDTYGAAQLQSVIFYAHRNRDWDTENDNRVTPVKYNIREVTPDESFSDPADGFAYAAYSAAYEEFGELSWDNLIEVECVPNDPLIKPMGMRLGQIVTIYYKDGAYTSILSGRSIKFETITLMFGTERINYTKRRLF